MNNYWHMMEQAQMSERKKEEIMNMLENNEKRTQKRRMPRMGKVILAAALAVGCVLSIAAGLPAQVYNFMSGGTMVNVPGSNHSEFTLPAGSPLTLENGRIWLTANGEKLDITDKMDENTPYIQEHTDPATGNKGYFVAGGTPERFGWAEFPVVDGAVSAVSGSSYEDWWYTMPDGSEIILSDLPMEEQMKLSEENGGGLTFTPVNRPWFQAALDQLGLED
jgi:hypothetical protein